MSPRQVLSAGHCAFDKAGEQLDPEGHRVVLGRSDLSLGTGEVHEVAQVWVHSGYDRSTSENDFAVFVLDTPSRQPTVAVAPTSNFWQPETIALVSGWGCTTTLPACSSSPQNTLLFQASVRVRSSDVCAADAQAIGTAFSPSVQICGQPPGTTERACHGDSGGPLTATGEDGTSYLIGLVSKGVPDCRPGFSVFFALAAVGVRNTRWFIRPTGQEPIQPTQ